MLLNKLPEEILERIISHSKEQGRRFSDYRSRNSTVSGAFTWDRTKEGHSFWELVSRGLFTKYYEKYPEDKLPSEEEIKAEEDLYKFLNS